MSAEELNVNEAAAFLRVPENTVYRWIRQGVIPSYRIQGQHRFHRPEITAWARSRGIGQVTRDATPQIEQGQQVDLVQAVESAGIYYDVPGLTVGEVFHSAVGALPLFKEEGAAGKFSEELLSREKYASTAIGHGIAIPHPRHPGPWGGTVGVGVFFLAEEVDFSAPDGERVFVLFILLCQSIHSHLQTLSALSQFLHRSEVPAFLRQRPSREALFHHLAEAKETVAAPR